MTLSHCPLCDARVKAKPIVKKGEPMMCSCRTVRFHHDGPKCGVWGPRPDDVAYQPPEVIRRLPFDDDAAKKQGKQSSHASPPASSYAESKRDWWVRKDKSLTHLLTAMDQYETLNLSTRLQLMIEWVENALWARDGGRR